MKRNSSARNVLIENEELDPNLSPINESSIRFPRLAELKNLKDLKGSEHPHRGLEIPPEALEGDIGKVELAELVDPRDESEGPTEPPTDPGLPEPRIRRPEASIDFDTGGITLTQHPESPQAEQASKPEHDPDHEPTAETAGPDTTAVANSNLVLIHESSGKKLRIFDGLVIGRTEGNENFPQDSLISRKHCRLSCSPDNRRIYVEDLGTTNPTKINGTELRPKEQIDLRVGDMLEVGNQRFSVADNHTRSAFEDLPFPVNRRNGVVYMPARGSREPLGGAAEMPLEAPPEVEEEVAAAATAAPVPSIFHPATWDTTSLVSAGLLLIIYGASVVSYLAQMNEVTSPIHDPTRLKMGMMSSLLWPTGITILFLYRLLNFECRNYLSKGVALIAGFWIYVLSSYTAQHQDRAIYRIEANTINEFCITHFDESRCNRSLERINRKTETVAEALKELPDHSRARVVSLLEELRPEGTTAAPADQTSASTGKMPL